MRRSATVLVLMVLLIGACGDDGVDVEARDRCEADAGVGNCVERDGKWVPLGSQGGTTSAPTTEKPASMTTPTTAPSIYGKVGCELTWSECAYDKNLEEWVPVPGAERN